MPDPFVKDGQILWSFSGGRTSAYMLWRALQAYGGKLPNSHVVAFANTGREHEETLKFTDRCAKAWNVNITWLEAVVHDDRKGSTHKVVSYETASRQGQPFEHVIKKYGIPNKAYPHCNRELKLNPMKSFIENDIGWEAGEWNPCVGIRADEADRATGGKRGIYYPLVKAFVRKRDVLEFWKSQDFDLYIPEHKGNCLECHKKSDRKLYTLAKRHPEYFDWARRMEQKYSMIREERGVQFFYRRSRSVEDIFRDAQQPFQEFVDGNEVFDPELDASGGDCGEVSCEVFGDDGQMDFFRRAS